jgi:methyl-accepting chemotaxis protein
MSASSATVTKSVEATASVAEENSSASEEVSASTEEMSAQVQEALAAAHSLADTAEELQRIVGVFRTDGIQVRK